MTVRVHVSSLRHRNVIPLRSPCGLPSVCELKESSGSNEAGWNVLVNSFVSGKECIVRRKWLESLRHKVFQ